MPYLRILLFGCLFLSACAQLPEPKTVRPDQLTFPPLHFEIPTVAKEQLENGMRVYLKEDHELPLVELSLLYAGGSIQDPADKTGLSRLYAEVLETGGAGELTPADLENELESMAAEVAVSSSAYGYQIDLSLHRRDLKRGLEILADMLRRPRFDPDRLELAREQMLESIRRQNDEPASIAGRLLAEAVYPQHPFGRYPKVEIVNSLSRADLRELHQRYSRPNNLWLAVSGDIEQAELLALLQKNFSDWQSEPLVEFTLPKLPPAPAGRIWFAHKDIPQTSILMGHPGISKDNPDLLPLRVANYILGGGGFNSRMMREVRSNRGLAYSVYSYFQLGRRLPELFIAGSETKCASTIEVVTIMRKLIQQLIDEPVSEAELELAKQSLINSFVFAFTDSHSIVSRKMRLDFYAYPAQYLETYQQKIAATTIADVQRVAQLYLHPEQLQVVLVGDGTLVSDAMNELGLPIEKVALKAE